MYHRIHLLFLKFNFETILWFNFKIDKLNSPLKGLTSPFELWWLEMLVLLFGVVLIADPGEPGFTSLPGVLLPAGLDPPLEPVSLFTADCWLPESDVLDAFCCASRSCLRNLALRFWNHTWKFFFMWVYNYVSISHT